MTDPTDLSPASPRAAAAALLRQHWDGRLQVDPQRIAQALGLRVIARGGPDEPDYGYSGYFNAEGDAPTIEYNRSESLVRRRFTIAHELGHFALGHRSSPRDTPANFNTAVADGAERHANQFAAELLMPEHEVRIIIKSGRFANVGELTRAFGVSQAAMIWRMKDLGFI